jgi:hypothetical protein
MGFIYFLHAVRKGPSETLEREWHAVTKVLCDAAGQRSPYAYGLNVVVIRRGWSPRDPTHASRLHRVIRYDLEPARRLCGSEPQDRSPDGLGLAGGDRSP